MPIAVRSFAKINVGLRIGARREDGFHDLRTVYQTIALHDVIHIQVARGSGIEIRSRNPSVPLDDSNTCYRMAERVMHWAKARGRVAVQIDKNLPVQSGLGAASSNAVATLLGLERALKLKIPAGEKLRMAAGIGSDVPLFLIGGTILGMGRGEEVYPLHDLPVLACVVATPNIGVSTPRAFADWDSNFFPKVQASGGGRFEDDRGAASRKLMSDARSHRQDELTPGSGSDKISKFSQSVFSWLCGNHTSTGVSIKDGGRAEALLLDLVRAGIENDFERVVFPQHPELRDIKRVLEGAGAKYASLSGSGSALYGLFVSRTAATSAAKRLRARGVQAEATVTLGRPEYWKKLVIG